MKTSRIAKRNFLVASSAAAIDARAIRKIRREWSEDARIHRIGDAMGRPDIAAEMRQGRCRFDFESNPRPLNDAEIRAELEARVRDAAAAWKVAP